MPTSEHQVWHTGSNLHLSTFIPIARKALKQQGIEQVKIATVTNFPHGNDDIEIAVAETKAAVAYGQMR